MVNIGRSLLIRRMHGLLPITRGRRPFIRISSLGTRWRRCSLRRSIRYINSNSSIIITALSIDSCIFVRIVSHVIGIRTRRHIIIRTAIWSSPIHIHTIPAWIGIRIHSNLITARSPNFLTLLRPVTMSRRRRSTKVEHRLGNFWIIVHWRPQIPVSWLITVTNHLMRLPLRVHIRKVLIVWCGRCATVAMGVSRWTVAWLLSWSPPWSGSVRRGIRIVHGAGSVRIRAFSLSAHSWMHWVVHLVDSNSADGKMRKDEAWILLPLGIESDWKKLKR